MIFFDFLLHDYIIIAFCSKRSENFFIKLTFASDATELRYIKSMNEPIEVTLARLESKIADHYNNGRYTKKQVKRFEEAKKLLECFIKIENRRKLAK